MSATAQHPRSIGTHLRGAELLSHPGLNKGTAFSRGERFALGLEALLPYQVETLEQQVQRVWAQFQELDDPLQRFAFAAALRQNNLILFHRFLEEHIEAVLPIVYTPTVGAAIQRFSATYRTPSQGLYLAAPDQDRLAELLAQGMAQTGLHPPDLLLVTDSEGILGIGDQGIGGIHICQGKLAVYTLCAGLDPERALPVVLDVGTDRADLLADPLYPGWRQPRLRGEAYDDFIATFVAAVEQLAPHTFLHWEDFGTANARHNLETYRHRLASFNDDIQGTSGVASAAVLAAAQGLGQTLAEQRIVIFGAGTAGFGIAERLARLLERGGLSALEARRRIWLIDRQGLLRSDHDGLASNLQAFARPLEELAAFPRDAEGRIPLQAVVEQVKPSVLIGTSTVAGAFDRAVVEAMAAGAERPIILPLSNPTALAEAHPADLLAWSGGRALVATGSPFEPVSVAGVERRIGQCNNCFLFPGLGLASAAVGASQVSEDMIDAALRALALAIPAALDPEAPLMPALTAVRTVSRAVAEAVAFAAVDQGLARRARSHAEAIERLDAATWEARYRPIEAL
ncbi:oxaloacetate-decarboxylating malate dehydrogenase [Cyanobium sp. Morenito 9A2]|nr:oxaloacetate-decarboxylating malate dehydrogenase [Cyanobium sp. Morenito 9A2]